ncbi:putative zinc protease-like protein y4wB [Halomicronema hongdechloris C2206]|uniref:Zinc protease-like protein y4wB n=1 Tax=Halomicronema hongdechloris C2206 TaxID=1641165 RepID=A0A1Z3HUE3_9CYAN|nr:pitrilysin family protein [Halomicronema hongdechloris]ASC73940.1 putative zinc protease-like protein y4wB [Halomicronema hongdechloris C2206]
MNRRLGIGHKWLRTLLLGLATLVVLLGVNWSAPAIATPAHHYTELDFPPLGQVQIPDYERYELANGLVVYLMEDHELPLVSGTASFRTGSRLEPADKVGLAALMGDAMRLGGTETYSPDQLNRRLEQRAAAVETGVDDTSGSASFNALSDDLADVFALFADVIQHPAFAPDQVELLRKQYRGSIARRNDDPGDVASREFRKLVYGAENPYARTMEYATLAAISRDDIIDFYRASVRPERTILGIVGDFDSAQMKALIAEQFADWRPQGTALDTTVPMPSQQAQTGVFSVDQPQLSQSYVQLGHLGGQLSNPDHPALSVLNEVLNGFGGRLFNQVRSRQGLAYVVYAFWAPRYDYPGMIIGGGQTRSDATVSFIESVQAELQRVRSQPITPAELQRAKDGVLNSFVFNFQSPDQTLSRLIRYEYYDYPSDFIFQFQRQVEAVTAEAILAGAQANLQPDQLVTLVVGNQANIQPTLDSLDPDTDVTQIDITIPSPPA